MAQIIVPTVELTREAVKQTNITIGVAVGLILIGLVALWFAIGQIVSKPIKTIVATAKQLAIGDVNSTGC